MRTFVQKQKPIQKTKSTSPVKQGRAFFGQSREIRSSSSSILHLQRTIGNQAVQRLLQANTSDVKGDSTTMELARFGHDFSRIPVYTRTPVRIQSKLTVNAPGDIYEQEADQVADQVMRMPESQIQRQIEPQEEGEEVIHTKETADLGALPPQKAESSELPPVVHEVLRSSGQPLDPETRSFLEPRFGHDFSQVRVHTDAKAAESARTIDALAFTLGKHIVFGAEQYRPTTSPGRQLLAHDVV